MTHTERRMLVHQLPVGSYWLIQFMHNGVDGYTLRHRCGPGHDRAVAGHDGTAYGDKPEELDKIRYCEGTMHKVDPECFHAIDMLLISGMPQSAKALAMKHIIRSVVWENVAGD